MKKHKPTLLRMREGKPGGGKGPLLSEDVSLTLTGVQDVLFQPMLLDERNHTVENISPTLKGSGPAAHRQVLLTPASSRASEDSISDSIGLDGEPLPSARSSRTPQPSSPATGPTSPTSETSSPSPIAFGTSSLDNPKEDGLAPPVMEKRNGQGTGSGPTVFVAQTGSTPPSGPEASPARTSASPASGGGSGSTTAKVVRVTGDYENPSVMVDDYPMLAANPMSDRQMTVVTGMPTEPEAGSPSPSSTSSEQLNWLDQAPPTSCSRTCQGFSLPMAVETWQRSSVRFATSGTAWRTGLWTRDTPESLSGADGCSSSGCECVMTTLTDILQPSVPQRYSLSPRAAAGILRRAARRGRDLPPHLEQALRSQADLPDDTERASTPPLTTAPSSSPAVNTETKRLGAPDTQAYATTGSSVRRLSPVETERLMGLPDGWTIARDWQGRSPSSPKAVKEPTSEPPKSKPRRRSPRKTRSSTTGA